MCSEKAMSTQLQYSCLENPMEGGAWWAVVHGLAKSQTRLSDFTFSFHFHALEKEMATHSNILAWRIPGTGEPGGLPSYGVAQSRTWRKRLSSSSSSTCVSMLFSQIISPSPSPTESKSLFFTSGSLLQSDSLLSESPGKTLQRGGSGQFGAQAEREMESSVPSPDVQCGRPNKVIIYKEGQFLGNSPRVTHSWYIFQYSKSPAYKRSSCILSKMWTCCLHVHLHKAAYTSGVRCHVCAPSTRGCASVYFIVQYCIEYYCAVSLFQAQNVPRHPWIILSKR